MMNHRALAKAIHDPDMPGREEIIDGAIAECLQEDWETCRIGSCHRHQKCMYRPCRS